MFAVDTEDKDGKLALQQISFINIKTMLRRTLGNLRSYARKLYLESAEHEDAPALLQLSW